MGQIHFFTELSKLKNQPLIQLPLNSEYGPVDNSRYRVTSLHSIVDDKLIEDAKCFAICDGNIRFQQDNTNSELLNMVLYPVNVDFNGIPVKYFVYRGIMKKSIIDENSKILIDNPSDLTILKIINEINTKNQDENQDENQGVPSINCLGIGFSATNPILNLHLKDNDLIDTLFFENTTFKPIKVNGGDSLGLFNRTVFGIEIILENVMYEPSLDILRNVNLQTGGNILDTNNIDFALDINNPTPQEKRAFRERILSYLDPCAFFSNFYSKGINIYENKSISKNDLYDQIISKFTTCNKIYIDIRNQNGMSLNYYKQYLGDNCNIKIDLSGNFSNTLQDTVYNTYSWPIKILENSIFNSENHFFNKSLIRISLPISGNKNPQVFLSNAPIFSRRKKISWVRFYLTPKYEKNHKRFLFLNNNDNWSDELLLSVRYIKESIIMNSYIKLYYIDIPINNTEFNSLINTNHYLDNLFRINEILNYKKWKNSNPTNYWLDGGEKFFSFFYHDSKRFEGMVKTGVAVDEYRITFYAVPFISSSKKEKIDYKNIEGSSANKSFFQSLNFTPNLKKGIQKQYSEDNSAVFSTILTFEINNSLFCVSFLKSEFQSIVDKSVNFHYNKNLHPIFLSVKLPSYINNYTIDFQTSGYKSDGVFYSNVLDLRGFTVDGKIVCTESAAKIEEIPLSSFSPSFLISELCTIEEKNILTSVINDIKKFNPDLYKSLINVIDKFKIEILFEDLEDKLGGSTIRPNYLNSSIYEIDTSKIFNYDDYKKVLAGTLSVDLFKPIFTKIDNTSLEINKKNKEVYAILNENSKFLVKLNKKYITKGSSIYFSDEKQYKILDKIDKSAGDKLITVYSKEHSPRRLELGRILSHELGHVIYMFNNPLITYAWEILEFKLRSEPGELLKNVGQGHLKGSPNAREACLNDKFFYEKYADFVNIEFNEIIKAHQTSSTSGSNIEVPFLDSKRLPPFDSEYCSNNL